MRIPKHELEAQRLEALRHYGDLDAPYDIGLQELVAYASEACGVPISIVSMVEGDRQSFRAELGFGRSSTPLDESFCAHTILHSGVFEISDATLDPRFAHNPLVAAPDGVRFYAGVAIEETGGLPLGAFCVIDKQPRVLTDFQRRSLILLGKQAEVRLELIKTIEELKKERAERVRAAAERERLLAELHLERHRLETMLQLSPAFAAILCGDDLTYEYVNPAHEALLGNRGAVGKRLIDAMPELQGQGTIDLVKRVLATGEPYRNAAMEVSLGHGLGGPLTTRILDVVYQAIREIDGTISGVFTHGFDVTDHVLGQRSLVHRAEPMQLFAA